MKKRIIVTILLLFFFSYIFSINAKAENNKQPFYSKEQDRTSIDADYILSNQTYSITPNSEFKREPKYGFYNLSNICVGDIIYESDTFIGNIGHAAIVVDISHYYYDANGLLKTYIQTVEAVGGGVQYGFLDDTRIAHYGTNICRVYLSTTAQKQAAVNFCLGQIGKWYWYDMDNTPIDIDENQHSWYCSELVYAAYYNAMNQGLQVGTLSDGHIMPFHIYDSWQTSTIIDYDDIFLNISISSSNPKWTIEVDNYTDNPVTVYYNTRMCFENDAMNWNNLIDVSSFSLSSGSSSQKRIYERLFAGYITFSYIYNDGINSYRLVTYANNLSTNGTLSKHVNIIVLS
ncbi:hypothetical protein J6Y73_04310 [bacterium]|nr:hypothetical protein [bacterium]